MQQQQTMVRSSLPLMPLAVRRTSRAWTTSRRVLTRLAGAIEVEVDEASSSSGGGGGGRVGRCE